MQDSYYSADIAAFLSDKEDAILGVLTRAHHHALEHQQRNAWIRQIRVLKEQLGSVHQGHLFFEFSIPRMGKRADVVLMLDGLIWVIEFKVGSDRFDRAAIEQVHDYALDLKNFHLGSHDIRIVPVLIATEAAATAEDLQWASDGVAGPILIGPAALGETLSAVGLENARPTIDVNAWRASGYRPTPTIIEAAEALYRRHDVSEISRSDAGAKNLKATADKIADIIERSKREGLKSICFITGVPGAGKTLAGLNIAAKRAERHEDEHAVFLSGNGPLVDVLREALARDQSKRENIPIGETRRRVKTFVQNIHHFRDHYLESSEMPFEKVVVFDEAQRAWTSDQASKFMQSRRGNHDFNISEPEFLISVMDRHTDWCTVICLIGGGQEINTGEAGLSEWLTALEDRFPHWDVHASNLLDDRHYTSDAKARELLRAPRVNTQSELHLSVAMRSFRAEKLSTFVSQVLDGDARGASGSFAQLQDRYPIFMTRDLDRARDWLRTKARGSERYGFIASSGAYRLRPEGLHVKAKIDPATWFLNDREDVRSSFYLEEVATQFDVQGLELDWAGVCWDTDLRWAPGGWGYFNFKGTKWQQVRDATKQLYLLNAYRVLLTRARQGLVIFVPSGDVRDVTRSPEFYDRTAAYLASCGIQELPDQ